MQGLNEQINKQLKEALANIDYARIEKETQQAINNIDWQKIKSTNRASHAIG